MRPQHQMGVVMYNILSLDGGGSWAIIQVMTLQKLYGDDAPGSHVLKNFDLVAANSGGSIVAAALFLDMKLSTIRALFEDRTQRRKIFVSLPFGSIASLAGLGPRYEPAKVRIDGRDVLFWDGGVTGFNNPILAGVTEAKANGIASAEIRILSLGT